MAFSFNRHARWLMMPTGPGHGRVGIRLCGACQGSDNDLPGDSVSLPFRSRVAASSLRHTSSLRGTIVPPNPCVRRHLNRRASSRQPRSDVGARVGTTHGQSDPFGARIATSAIRETRSLSRPPRIRIREQVRSLVLSCSRMFSFMIETRSGSGH